MSVFVKILIENSDMSFRLQEEQEIMLLNSDGPKSVKEIKLLTNYVDGSGQINDGIFPMH